MADVIATHAEIARRGVAARRRKTAASPARRGWGTAQVLWTRCHAELRNMLAAISKTARTSRQPHLYPDTMKTAANKPNKAT